MQMIRGTHAPRLFVVSAARRQDGVALIHSIGHGHRTVAREELMTTVMDLVEVEVAA